MPGPPLPWYEKDVHRPRIQIDLVCAITCTVLEDLNIMKRWTQGQYCMPKQTAFAGHNLHARLVSRNTCHTSFC